ncbi:MAG: CapA family protein, partial [Chloroflexi bacterium]|nr:CapA family protein [Chloroflexota bacterium]
IAAPPEWQPAVIQALAQLAAGQTAWDWQLVDGQESAGITLSTGDGGFLVGQQPLALAVPFTTNWEGTTWREAQSILQEGHPLVTVVPWADLSPAQKPLRIDGLHPADPTYPLQQPWSLVAAPGFESAAAELAATLQGNPMPDQILHLAAVGDVMLDRALGYAIQQGDLAYPFAQVAGLLQNADLTVGNLESSLGDAGQPAGKSYTFQAPPAAANSLAMAGFDVLSLANNHAMDFGPEALLQGIGLLQEQGIAAVGAGANTAEARTPYFHQVNGLTLAFLGYVHVPVEVSGFDTQLWTATGSSPGLAWAFPDQIAADVADARQQADLVIVLLHSGYEYVAEPSPPQVAASRAAIDAGASLVIGHHAHILQGIEFYQGGVIVYGLGNFAFEIDGDPSTTILNVWLDQDGVRQLELVPAVIQFGGQPRPAELWEASAIRRQVYYLTTLLNPQ